MVPLNFKKKERTVNMSNTEGKVVMVQGRIVWVSGDLFKGKGQTLFGTQTPKLNPQGEQATQYGFGLAVSKAELANPERGAIWITMHEQAYGMFPSRQIPPSFAMKYKDGDGVDDQGAPFASREGYQGALVFAMTTNLPIRFFKFEGGQNIQVADGIKCGDYVDVQVMIKAHPAVGAGKAGLYLNPMAVRLVAPGKEIVNAPNGDQVFGTVAPVVPVGYVAPVQPAMPSFAPPAPSFAPPPQPQYAPPAPTPQAAPAPNYAVLPPQHQPPPGGQPTMMPPPFPGGVAYPAPAAYGPPPPQQYPPAPIGMPAIPR